MKTVYVVEIDVKALLSDKDYTEKMNGGINLNFLEERFPNNPKIGIYRGKKTLKGSSTR